MRIVRRPVLLSGVLAAMAIGVAVGCAAQAAAGTLPTSPAEYLRRMDTDHDGRVSRAEYVAWMLRNFDSIDANHDGVLAADELPPGARPISRADYVKSIQAGFARQDANRDGYLDARELSRPPR